MGIKRTRKSIRKMTKRFKKMSRRFGNTHSLNTQAPTSYQQEVNSLTGAMGPDNSALWKNTGSTTGNPWDMGAQPLYYSPSTGLYVTSYDQNAASSAVMQGPDSFGIIGSWNPSVGVVSNAFGSRKSRKGRKGRKSRKSRKSRKGRKGSRKGRKGSRFGDCGCPLRI